MQQSLSSKPSMYFFSASQGHRPGKVGSSCRKQRGACCQPPGKKKLAPFPFLIIFYVSNPKYLLPIFKILTIF
jgi:hypothetical protein